MSETQWFCSSLGYSLRWTKSHGEEIHSSYKFSLSLSVRQVSRLASLHFKSVHSLIFSYFPCNFELTVRNYQTGKEVIVTPSTRVNFRFIGESIVSIDFHSAFSGTQFKRSSIIEVDRLFYIAHHRRIRRIHLVQHSVIWSMMT